MFLVPRGQHHWILLAVNRDTDRNGYKINATGALFVNGKQQLQIKEASANDAARYSCIAENKVGSAVKDLVVSILKPPKMQDRQLIKEVQQSQQLVLECPIEDSYAEFSWRKNDFPVSVSNKVQISARGDKLYLMDAGPKDSAQYTCIAKNQAGEDRAVFNTTVNVAPKILDSPFRTMDVILNQTVEITCHIVGTPPPTVTWSFDGKPLLQTDDIQMDGNGTVIIHNVKSEDEGRYTCKAENKAGRAEADTYVQVIAPPRIFMQSGEIKVVAGRSATIRCEVFGSPAPEVVWLKNEQPFESEVLQTSTNLRYFHLREARVEDAGRYTCIAKNRAGEQRASTELHVLVVPVIEDVERVIQVKENNTLTISCTAEGIPPPQITWKKDGTPLSDVSGPRLVVAQAATTDAGRYTCTARNEGGHTSADFAVDVLSRPKFKGLKTDIRVVEGEQARLECKMEGHPPPTVRWLRGGRTIEDMSNFIISPRGETLLILKARRSDAGSYSCVAKNAAAETEVNFMVSVLVPPHIDEQLDQHPHIVQGKTLFFFCPVLGNPDPTVEWLKDGQPIDSTSRINVRDGRHLEIIEAQKEDEGRYTCHAYNEAGVLDTDFRSEIVAPPQFILAGESVYEVVENEAVTLDCGVANEPKPEIVWFRGGHPLYLDPRMALSQDSTRLIIRSVSLADGGKYTCKASNEAGSSNIDLVLKVLVPPKIDKSNIIGNPLAIVERKIYLECPVSGIPQPTVSWVKDGVPVDMSDSRLVLAQSNQTFGIELVKESDQARYTCIAVNKGGTIEQDFVLEVLTPPVLDTVSVNSVTRREGEAVSLILSDGRRLQISSASLTDAGTYTCVAANRAGESTLDFNLEIISPPSVDASRNGPNPSVIVGRPITLWCPVTGHPFPTIIWRKDGVEVTGSTSIRISDDGQMLEIVEAQREHSGTWVCSAENDAGAQELEIRLDVWFPPSVAVTSEAPIKAVGDTVTLLCEATGNPSPMLTWSKAGHPIGTRLDISHLDTSSAGNYTCSARNDAGSAESSIYVDVLVPPLIARSNIDMSPRLPTGQSLLMSCDATGKPEPSITWYVNGSEVSAVNDGFELMEKHLKIMNITLQDQGTYTCIAMNSAGNDTIFYNVGVVQAPIISYGGAQSVIEGEMARIECTAEGHPAPIISWLRNGIRVESGVQGVRYIAEGKVLTVIEARSSDSGIYVCEATNEAGTARQAYTLEVLVSPKIVSTSANKLTVAFGAPVSLKCGVRGYPEPEILWSVNNTVLPAQSELATIDKDGTLSVKSMSDRLVTYKCTAKNEAGTDEIEYEIHTISAPVVNEGVRSINSTVGEPTSLTCDITGDEHQIQWYKNDISLLPSSNVVFNDDKSTVNLVSTKLNDEGKYTCTAENRAGKAKQITNLYVGVPPKIVDGVRRKLVKKGETAVVWCEAVGVPQPAITWMRDDKVITDTTLDDRGNAQRKSFMVDEVSVEDAGVYTCKAENWAGTTTKDFDLVVIIPPTIVPDKLDFTVEPRKTVILPCNATGIPEPVVTWVKVPNIQIEANEKYQLIGTSLAVRNILPSDAGFYHCIAKSEAGQSIGNRRLIVDSMDNQKSTIWVDCDEENRPVKTTYMQNRGDVPDNDQTLLPWKEKLDWSINGTNGIIYKCIPGPRAPRLS
ncbi:hypothetical protein Q1695_000157 [Nippostrongylus brasiliensis]|nr:hypothetical protein Q1695_000157 [Nippostrongylus brasiliensis]